MLSSVATASVAHNKDLEPELVIPRFAQALNVQVVLDPALAGVLFKYADALALKRNEREMGLGTLATGHVLLFVACIASSNCHTPDAEVWLGVTGVFLIILPE